MHAQPHLGGIRSAPAGPIFDPGPSLLARPRRYYPALQPCVHYLPFWQGSEEDVLGLLSTLRSDPANDLMAQRIAVRQPLLPGRPGPFLFVFY